MYLKTFLPGLNLLTLLIKATCDKCVMTFLLLELKTRKGSRSNGSHLLWAEAVFLQRSAVSSGLDTKCREDNNRKVAGQRWQVASCHQSWRDGCCDILRLNNLHRNNTSALATVKCGSWLHVSLMPSPPNPFHNSAGTGRAAMCRHAAHWHQGHREWNREKPDAEEVKEGNKRGSVKVWERPQFTASIWLSTTLSQLAGRSGPLYRFTGIGWVLHILGIVGQ